MAARDSSGVGPVPFGAVPQVWLDGYGAWVSASQKLAAAWLQARTAQLQSNLQALGHLASCTEPAAALEIQQTWWRESVERMTAEMQDYQAQTTAVLRQAFSGLREPSPARPRAPTRAA